jgi:hypothetical protein
LRLTEFTGPRADHFLRTQIATLDELERIEELRAKAVRSPTVIGKRCDCA